MKVEGVRMMEPGRSFLICFKLNCVLVALCVFTNLILICDCIRVDSDRAPPSVIEVSMPSVHPKKDDDYLCTAKNIESFGTQYVHKFEPNSDADRAHHMLLFACDDVPDELTVNGWWDCGHHYQACRSMRIIYAWAKNAPPTALPKDVGLRIGAESNIKFIVLQVHYAHPFPDNKVDQSGFTIHVSPEEPKYLAGVMILFRSYLSIPPHEAKIHGDMNCLLKTNRPIHPFAYRVHTHKLGSVVSGYVFNETTGFTMIGKGNPQWPQAFYPTEKPLTINPNELIAARCTFTTLKFDKFTKIGQTAGDEMCNLYIMFYTDSRDPEEHYIDCRDEDYPDVSKYLPPGSDVPLPRNVTLEEHAKGHHMLPPAKDQEKFITELSDNSVDVKKKNHAKKRPGIDFTPEHTENSLEDKYILDGRLDADRQLQVSEYQVVSNWPKDSVHLGQASGVDFDHLGNVVVFHRGDRTWDSHTFNLANRYLQQNLGPIKSDTVYVIHPTEGTIIHQWGQNLFYMPHDISVAPNGDTFLTDVALHQVFKFEPGSTKPGLILGTKFEPGNDDTHFCKPAAVAAMANGDFFVADGYCNSRIIKFNSKGKKILQIGRPFQPTVLQKFMNSPPPAYTFYVPHALALAEEQDLICVADRENGRIQCFKASDLTHTFTIQANLFGGQLFSVAYSSVNGGTLYAVNGNAHREQTKVQGFVIPLSTRRVSSVFSPNNKGFGQPHDIAVSKNGTEIYVVEISEPYKVWKFASNNYREGKTNTEVPKLLVTQGSDPKEPERQVASGDIISALPTLPAESQPKQPESSVGDTDSFSTSVIIMAFLTIPLLLLIGIGALLRLQSNGCCKRSKETKSFAEFFPPSAGFEKLRMDESETDNSDTEVEEFAVSSYRKASA